MGKHIKIAVAAISVVVGAIWEWPLRMLELVEHIMTFFHLADAYDHFLTWLEHHPDFADEIGPWVLMMAGSASIGATYALPAFRRRFEFKPLEIVYDVKSQEFVMRGSVLHADGTESLPSVHYCIGIRNNTTDRTLSDVHARAEGDQIIQEFKQFSGGWIRINDLHPRVTVMVYLVGIFQDDQAPPDTGGGPNTVQHFLIRLRGRDVKEDVLKFEYDPQREPAIRKVS